MVRKGVVYNVARTPKEEGRNPRPQGKVPCIVRSLDERRAQDQGACSVIFGPNILPSSRRTAQEDISRYVRHEYRDDNPCWLSADASNGSCIKPTNLNRQGAAMAEPCSTREVPRTTGCRCPVLNAVSGGKRTADMMARGGSRADP